MATILKATTKGQITLPASWRNSFNTDKFIARVNGSKLEIEPLDLDQLVTKNDEYTVFDAIRDNQGKGIKAQDLVKVLKDLA
ncbi:MAG: hypothetical protein AUJ28_01705 [Parcubacteria group bacterium CG1_02_37_51]|uniref:SpoVT-AbrB domain-containing protein n=1 Tax=Candidatus Komeilibacteria bacterium CG_4_10_14_0_8_um_filter_37_78 TaxID=1974471 RepID=A0A2M7RCX4_9BACT|nr:MAG: hypothetical protein AUJ28_01705 [Parcubacteria group bacterium CG1_02_37_51]PIY94514.1 MAG: hypothetical protein COY67_02500 [Candidatus Komeilibacteria bacterium CG_4_10_14_0_8_um_filter_37_78]